MIYLIGDFAPSASELLPGGGSLEELPILRVLCLRSEGWSEFANLDEQGEEVH
jgi:hypothetical protein